MIGYMKKKNTLKDPSPMGLGLAKHSDPTAIELDRKRLEIAQKLFGAYMRYAIYTELGQPFYSDGVLWRCAQVLVEQTQNEGIPKTAQGSARNAACECLDYIDLFLQEMPSEKRVIFERIEALCVKHATKPEITAPSKADYSAPIIDDLLERIDEALPQTQAELSTGRVVAQVDRSSSKLLSILKAGHAMNISRASVYRLINSGQLPVIKIGGRVFVDPADIERLIANSRVVIGQGK